MCDSDRRPAPRRTSSPLSAGHALDGIEHRGHAAADRAVDTDTGPVAELGAFDQLTHGLELLVAPDQRHRRRT